MNNIYGSTNVSVAGTGVPQICNAMTTPIEVQVALYTAEMLSALRSRADILADAAATVGELVGVAGRLLTVAGSKCSG